MRTNILSLLVLCTIVSLCQAQTSTETPYWLDNAKQTHEKFTGQPGTFAHFGDSITVTLAFWTPLLYERKNAPQQMQHDFQYVKNYLRKECWRDWKGPKYGNEGSQTIRWAHKHIDRWLNDMNPEVALIMFGTNDLNSVPFDEYKTKLKEVINRCLENGTVVILSTIPPRHGFEAKSADLSQIIRNTAKQMQLPLIDYYTEIIKRRPDDWDGATEKFAAFNGYDVPTLIARDGVHPSNPAKYQDDYSPQGLRSCGFILRNYLTLTKYAEVIRTLKNKPKLIDPPLQSWFPKAPPLPAPNTNAKTVSTVPELIKAIESASPGDTILVKPGLYLMPSYVAIRKDNVTLRGATGDPRDVVIDGAQSRHGELIGITACKGVTIADLTIQNIKHNGFKINSETNVQDLTIYNCIIHNIWQRGIKGVKVPEKDRDKIRPRNFRISYCLFYNDRPKQYSDDPADTPANFRGNYIGGIDTMFAADWVISDNVFINLNGRTGEGRGAVFIWHDSINCIVERNIIIDCDAGVCLGNAHRPADIIIHCSGCVVSNNFITRAPQAGVVTVYTEDCRILNNTIHEPKSRLGRLIRVVFINRGLLIANNLLNGPDIRRESDDPMRIHDNIAGDFTAAFTDPANGNLHLKSTDPRIVDKAHVLGLGAVDADIDKTPRDRKPDIGADEFNNQSVDR